MPSTYQAPKLKRRTMVKPIVGQCRATTYKIPASDFIYGMVNVNDEPSAGDVVSNWDVAKQSKAKTTMQSFPATNNMALAAGCITAASQRQYAKENPVMKAKPTGSSSPTKKFVVPEGVIYGIQSEQNEIPMSLVMSAPSDPERDYPMYSQHTVGKLPPPRATKSSDLYAKKNAPVEPKALDSFKMKKFAKVKAKVVMGPK
mmetsp:Transcript_28448/g.56890  ORF Transcript_28448/g.56890 Transcript_28448/m.56890 type:complete len:201 (+) Transcript_28448:111-713(+)|eukprot:CAMPEP_0182457460 /NCGR_PEP_ID=MMETSP1319-20130603/3027_1 /TAXON_ID=172717 /ORGANISM="Bolidomonas pacifica, Strain RCC208" /LENGTH=200 /DNA_ID=CAMNT_0024655933 /DNA_START=94 /DNA_END=696 /DNA_ORIENTATION=-